MLEIGENAKKASHSISVLNSKKKNDILLHAAENLMKNKKKIQINDKPRKAGPLAAETPRKS